MLNRVVLVGRMGRDPELRYTPSGIPVSSFSIAVDRPMAANAQGERETDWIDIVAWRQNAEFAANYLGKGRLVAVEGRLQIRSYQAQDGTKRRVAEVVADNLKALGRPREAGEGGGGYTGGPAQNGPAAGAVDEAPAYDDPFQDE